MRRTSTEKTTHRKRSLYLAASALAVTASMAGTGALADHKHSDQQYNHHQGKNSYHQEHYRYGPIYQQQNVRVHIPLRDHGPETLPLGRLIMQNSNVDLDRYRLVAVVTRNGRHSNGYASLRTGNSRTHRYFLGAWEQTRIPAPSRADSRWHLRLGPGTQVRSLTAVLEPRHGWSYRQPTGRRHASVHQRNHHAAQSTPWLGLAWMLANAGDDDRQRSHKQAKRVKKLRAEQARTRAELAKTERQLERSRKQNKRLKDQRARLAEELAHERVDTRPGKRRKPDGERKKSGKGERATERHVKRTVRYVVAS